MPINLFESYGGNSTQFSQAETDKNLVSRWEIITRRIAPPGASANISNSSIVSFGANQYADMAGYQSFQMWMKFRFSNVNSSNNTRVTLKMCPRWMDANGTIIGNSTGKHGSYNWGTNQKANGSLTNYTWNSHPAVNSNTYGLYAGYDSQTTMCISGMVDHTNYVNTPAYLVEQTWYSEYNGLPMRSTSTITYNSLNTNINTWRFVGVNVGCSVNSSSTKYVMYLLGSRTGNT